MDKEVLVQQLTTKLRAIARSAHESATAAQGEAATGATPKEKREDARVSIEFSSLAKGQTARAKRAFAEVALLEGFKIRASEGRKRVQVGSVVEIEDCEGGGGKTFFVAPVGAGTTLVGPDGDGFLTVVTPKSPIGVAVMGKRENAIVDVTIKGDVREWKITWVD